MSGKKRSSAMAKKQRAQRATSNVFAMFDQNQIQEFKEAFYMIDQDKDGFITKEDLADMFASLGRAQSDELIEQMLNEASGPINFTMFLTLFGCKMSGTDPEDVIRNAFACIDESGTGLIGEDYLRQLATTLGDRLTLEEAEELFSEISGGDSNSSGGLLDCTELTQILKYGKREDIFSGVKKATRSK